MERITPIAWSETHCYPVPKRAPCGLGPGSIPNSEGRNFYNAFHEARTYY